MFLWRDCAIIGSIREPPLIEQEKTHYWGAACCTHELPAGLQRETWREKEVKAQLHPVFILLFSLRPPFYFFYSPTRCGQCGYCLCAFWVCVCFWVRLPSEVVFLLQAPKLLPDPHSQSWSLPKIPHHWPQGLHIVCVYVLFCTLVSMRKQCMLAKLLIHKRIYGVIVEWNNETRRWKTWSVSTVPVLFPSQCELYSEFLFHRQNL